MGVLIVVVSVGIATYAIYREVHKVKMMPCLPFCHYCGRKFLSPRGVLWHIQASHPHVEDWYGEKEATR